MSRKIKKRIGKKGSPSALRDKHWKQLLAYVEEKEWQDFADYLTKYPWLATGAIGRNLLPEYLQGEKDYGILRVLCNVAEVPVWVIQTVVDKGARDKEGRAYLERLLVDHESKNSHAGGDSPLVAAKVLLTNDKPATVIERMQTILEQGAQDDDQDRKQLAQRCIGRSELFYDLLMLLYEHGEQARLPECLANQRLLESAAAGELHDIQMIQTILDEGVVEGGESTQ